MDTLTKPCLFHREDGKVVALGQAADLVELRWRVIELEEELEMKRLQLQTSEGLVEENATLQSKAERMRTATTHIQSESDAVFMLMDKIWGLFNKKKGVVTKVKNLKQRDLDLEAELYQSSQHATAAKGTRR